MMKVPEMLNEKFKNDFTLIVKDTFNNTFELLYDPFNGCLLNKKDLSFLNYPKNTYFSYTYPKILSIVLGVKCNLHCKYCIQSNLREKLNIDFTPNKVDSFLNKLSKLNLNNFEKIILWGGEPFVYWKTIKLLIPKLKQMCSNLKNFFISTNGTLLSWKKLKFLLDNNVSLQISDDIFNEDRAVDLNKTRILLNKFKEKYPEMSIAIHGCVSTENPDMLSIVKKAEDIFSFKADFRFVPISPPLFKEDWYYTSMNFNKISAKLLEESTYQSYLKCSQFLSIDKRFFYFTHANCYNEFACRFAIQQEICIDVDGNIYACRGSFDKRNIISHLDQYIFPIKTEKFRQFTTRVQCNNCPLIAMCKGICSQLPDKEIKDYCLGHYAYQRGHLRAILKLIFNLDLIKILDVDRDKIFQHNNSYHELLNSWYNIKYKSIPIKVLS